VRGGTRQTEGVRNTCGSEGKHPTNKASPVSKKGGT
jgi:hypothetical protein